MIRWNVSGAVALAIGDNSMAMEQQQDQFRDLVLQFSNRLAGEWSANSVCGLLTEESIDYVASAKKWEAMEPLIRARLVLSPLFLRKYDLDEMHGHVMKLRGMAVDDRNEWVKMLGAAVGEYDGRIHTDEVENVMPMVKSSIDEIAKLAEGVDPLMYRPLEEDYLIDEVLADTLRGVSLAKVRQRNEIVQHAGTKHFTLRDPKDAPKVEDLSMQHRDREKQGGGLQAPLEVGNKRMPSGGSNGFLPPKKPRIAPSSSSSLFMKPSTVGRKPLQTAVGRDGGSKAGANKKKTAVLDISAINQAREMNRKRQEELKKQKEEEKEAQAQERAEAAAAQRKAIEERRMMMKEAERRRKEQRKEKEREEKQKRLEEAKQQREEERQRKREIAEENKMKRMYEAEYIDPSAISRALQRAGQKSDQTSVNEVQDEELKKAYNLLKNAK